jgi:DNA repair photolyase
MEPRAATPARRLDAIREISAAGIPVGVLTSPIIPGLNDSELESILRAAREAGATSASYLLVRLPHDVKNLFREWLSESFPDRASKVMSLIHDVRNGKDNDPRFGSRMRGSGPYAELIGKRFKLATEKLGLNVRRISADRTLFRAPGRDDAQLALQL